MASGTSASIRGKNSNPTELRMVLVGGRRGGEPCGKSSVGNLILGRDVFETNRRTSKSVMRQAEVSGRRVAVVDTPGWMDIYPLDLTPKLTQLEIQRGVNLCPLGPHAFVLVMPLDTTYAGTGMSVEEHVNLLLSDQVWRHAVVVFTVANKNKMKPVGELIRSDSAIRLLTKKCEGRFHVLNITDRGNGCQVTELLEKIEQMVTSNGGGHYETEKHVSEELKETTTDTQKRTTGRPKDIGRTDVRIVMLGRCWSGKSSAGNTILGGDVFKVGVQRSVHCELSQGEVAGRRVTVVDTPGWYYNSPLQDTSEMDKLEIQNSVSFCPLGPHAVLLTIPLNKAFTKAQRVALEEHVTLLTQRLWSYAIVLFTYGDWLGDKSIEQHIEAEGEDLRWLLDKCGNRYHVFSNDKREDTQQVAGLLDKIEEMVAGNGGGHYEVDGDVSKKLSERKRNIQERAKTSMTRTHRQRTALKALFEGEHQRLPEVRLMVVGGEQDELSSAGDHILQETVFRQTLFKEFKTQTKLTECVRQQRSVTGRTVSVVNCPDWSTAPPSQKTKDVLLHGVTLCSPGPHAVLVNVPAKSSFSEADRRSVEERMELLGDRVWRHALVLFTRGYWLGGRRVEEHIESEGEPLRWLLEKCGYRYHVLQCSRYEMSEVTELMEKIEDMVTRTRGHFGTVSSSEDKSVSDSGHFRVGHETRQLTLFERLKGKKTLLPDDECNRLEEEWKKREEGWRRREEEWKTTVEGLKKREEEMIERMLRFVVMKPEEPTLPRRWSSKEIFNPSMSDGTPPETGYSSSCPSLDKKVFDWLKRCPGTRVPSSPVTDFLTDADVMSETREDVS